MAYEEDRVSQNDRLAAQYRQVRAYLSTVADEAERERIARWTPPGPLSPEEYQQFVQPLRGKVLEMLAYPPPGTPVASNPRLEQIGEDDDGTFFRLTVPLLQEGLSAYGLVIRPAHIKPNAALAVAIHGGGGTPELAAEILGETNYQNMGRRLARRGHLVWMPACYERTTFDEASGNADVHGILDRRARLVGTTLAAIDAYTIIRSTEAMLRWARLPAAIAVGLSYGGFRALEVTALSQMFTACISSCYFNDRRPLLEQFADDGRFTDWFFDDVLRIATDVEFCRLICPRPLCIEVGASDDLFPVAGAQRAAEQVRAVYRSQGVEDRFVFDAFTGCHEFSGTAAFDFLDRLGY